MPPPARASAAVAAGLTALVATQSLAEGRGPVVTTAAIAGTAAVALGVRHPHAVVVLVAASVAGQALAYPGDPLFGSFLALMVAFYVLGRHRSWASVAFGAAVTALALLVVLLNDPRPFVPVELIFPLVYFGAAVTAGRLVRGRDQHAHALLAAATREAAARERAALAEERARIARDMHDVVAHSVSLLVIQAESAAAVLPHDPQRAAAQVERVADSGRQALDELRRVLGVLRAPAQDAAVTAQPCLADLPVLAETVRATGRAVLLELACDLDSVPPGLQLAAYRVVQESLTNAVRHGAAREVCVRVRRDRDRLLVEVVDDGVGCPDGSGADIAGGQGITGMRERMRAYDGQLDAGPRPGGGWQVRAMAPLEQA